LIPTVGVPFSKTGGDLFEENPILSRECRFPIAVDVDLPDYQVVFEYWDDDLGTRLRETGEIP
jgi:hypothetical protein